MVELGGRSFGRLNKKKKIKIVQQEQKKTSKDEEEEKKKVQEDLENIMFEDICIKYKTVGYKWVINWVVKIYPAIHLCVYYSTTYNVPAVREMLHT